MWRWWPWRVNSRGFNTGPNAQTGFPQFSALGCLSRAGFLCLHCFVLILQFVDIGIVTSIEINHKQVDVAKKGQEVCVKIEPIPGESPKMYGRHFEATDILVSKVSPSVRGVPLKRWRSC